MAREWTRRRHGRCLVLVAGLSTLMGCGDLLEVRDPDLLGEEDISGIKGADLLWGGALLEFSLAFVNAPNGSGHALISGLMADELHNVGPDGGHIEVDARNTQPENGRLEEAFQYLHRARVATENAADFIEDLAPGDPRIGEMWNLNAYAYVMLAEDFCSGVTFSTLTRDGETLLGEPRTTREMLELALSRFDTATARAGNDEDLRRLARIGRARTLVGLGRYDEAAQAATSVPTGWSYALHFGTAQWNSIQTNTSGRFSLSDREGGNGLPFRSAQDPRIPWVDGGVGTAGQSPLFIQKKFPDRDSPVVLAGGLEARYIEAEAALARGEVAEFVGYLNDVRDWLGMDPVSDPGTSESRIDLLFYERGFTLFGEGHRLGDLRRLVRQYGRMPDQVFPTGAYHLPGFFYGSDVNLDLPYAETDNPNFVGCLDRGA